MRSIFGRHARQQGEALASLERGPDLPACRGSTSSTSAPRTSQDDRIHDDENYDDENNNNDDNERALFFRLSTSALVSVPTDLSDLNILTQCVAMPSTVKAKQTAAHVAYES